VNWCLWPQLEPGEVGTTSPSVHRWGIWGKEQVKKFPKHVQTRVFTAPIPWGEKGKCDLVTYVSRGKKKLFPESTVIVTPTWLCGTPARDRILQVFHWLRKCVCVCAWKQVQCIPGLEGKPRLLHLKFLFVRATAVRCWWLMPVILATWEAEIGRIKVWGQPRKKCS
jgi:hypothetical protein